MFAVASVSSTAAARKNFFFFLPIQKPLLGCLAYRRIKSDPLHNALVLLPPVAVYDFWSARSRVTEDGAAQDLIMGAKMIRFALMNAVRKRPPQKE